jgi:hypothetical protein
MVVSQKPYNGNEYVKLGTYNLEIVNDYTHPDTILMQTEHIMHFSLY